MEDEGEVPGSRPVGEILRTDPIARVMGAGIESPELVGLVFALLVLAAIVFAPSAGSRFIYTNF